ncbi:MAG: hypothetical protein OK457_01940 [Thaumarchaeota archaeon]|nr:hypothetical protein [Nitrososphaerota archaeon]
MSETYFRTSMAHLTLTIPDDAYEDMKRHPEIRWSEIIKKVVVSYLEEKKETTSTKEIYRQLSEDTLRRLKAIRANRAVKYGRKLAFER